MSTTEYSIEFSKNPNFQTVLGLTNRTFDPDNVPIVSGRGATEDQLGVVNSKIAALQSYVDEHSCDDPFELFRERLDELAARQEACCAVQQDEGQYRGILDEIHSFLETLETQIESCCNNTGYCSSNPFTASVSANQVNTNIAGKATPFGTKRVIDSYWFVDTDGTSHINYRQTSQGRYQIDTNTGALTFTPETGFTGDADPITIEVVDVMGCTARTTWTPSV